MYNSYALILSRSNGAVRPYTFTEVQEIVGADLRLNETAERMALGFSHYGALQIRRCASSCLCRLPDHIRLTDPQKSLPGDRSYAPYSQQHKAHVRAAAPTPPPRAPYCSECEAP